MPEEIVISPAVPEDAPEIARLHRLAFGPGKFYQAVFGSADPAELDKIFAERMVKVIGSSDSEVVTACRTSDKRMLGFAFYDKPRPWKKQDFEPRPLPSGVDVEFAQKVFKGLHDAEQAVKEERYHLHIISVDPTIQRSGVGKKLLLHLQSLAERDNVPIYLESLEEGVPVYPKLGYKPWTEDAVFGPGAWWRPMVWRPENTKQSNGHS